MANNIPVSIDYTNRDYYSLRADLISRVQARLADAGKLWTATDAADFGVAFVEAMAYVGDVTNYYIDRMANESNLATATQRQSLLNIANSYGYVPSGYKSSIIDLTFSNATSTELVIPSGTQLTTNIVTTTATSQTVVQLIFTLQEEVAVPANGSAVGTAIHGEEVSLRTANAANIADSNDIAGELLGYSNGNPNQKFTLSENRVSDGSVRVYVRNGDYYNYWSIVSHLADYGSTDAVVSLTADSDNNVSIVFGNGISGVIPTYGEPIKVTYIVGGGVEGNVTDGQVFTISKVPLSSGISLSSLSGITASNATAAYGGDDPESNDSIRTNAPEALRTLRRAVTLADFRSLGLAVDGVGKAAAHATTPTSVVLYAGPIVSDVSPDYYPGMDSTNSVTTTIWDALKTSVVEYFADKMQIGTTLTVVPPSYTDVELVIEYTKNPQYTDEQAIAAIKYGVVYGFGYNFLDFDGVIYPEDIEAALVSIPSARSVRVISLYRSGASVSRSTLAPADGEYFVFKTANLTVTPVAGLGDMSITIGDGSLSPAFSPSVFDYSVVTTSAAFTITPTVANSTSTVTVNGTSVTSGSASSSIPLVTGLNTIPVVVTSADSTVSRTYAVKVTKS
jgi:hypothetical protein